MNLIGNHFIDSSYFNGTGSSLCSEGVAYNLPHFLQKEAVKLADSTWIFQTPNISYYLKPFAQLNDTWLFEANNTITATVVSIDTFQIIGQNDSVKKILLSTGDSIFLSKNYGLLRFPTFDSTLYIEWAGIQTRSLGDTIFHYREIFDFEVGDVFYYDIYRGEGSSMIPSNFDYKIFKKVKATVTSKTETINNLSYGFHCDIKTKVGYAGTPTVSTIDTIRYFYNSNTLSYNAYPHQGLGGYGGYPLMEWDSTFNCPIKKCPYGYIFGNINQSDTLWGRNCFEVDIWSGMTYGKGIGIIHSGQFHFAYGASFGGSADDTALVGYIKNGISVGTIYPDWQFTATEKEIFKHFILFPNPVENAVSLSFAAVHKKIKTKYQKSWRKEIAINN